MRTMSRAMSCVIRVVVAAFAVACVSTAAPGEANDPASVEAPTAAAPEGASVLEPAASTHDHGAAAGAPMHAHAAPEASGSEHAGHDHTTHEGVMYTCPMHPEVKDSQAGKCPKCGMNLEPVKPEGK